MNKHCYRIIFSRTHGELRVVPEIARSCSTHSGQSRGPGAPRLWVTLQRGAWLLSLLMFTTPVLAAGIVADNNAVTSQRPDVIATQNGLPQVNITAPNQAGISHNQYSQFDVDNKGAILNNSAVMTSTQMAGMIQGNPNLNPNKAPASVILNEVNSTNPSQLRGYMEVAGGRAQVIVANPSGIVCNGCGTINAGRMTLTTGKPQLNADGSLAGYQVEQGVIRVEGGGLNGDSRQDTQYVDVLARAVEVNAGVWAKEKINVVAGRNRVSADGNTVSASKDNGSAKPELAIDMGQLGGMYSGQIRMVGTEAGVGVRNQGAQLQAGKTLTVSSEGHLVWQGDGNQAVTQAGESISLTAKGNIEHNGKLHSDGTLDVLSREGDIVQSGTMAAAGDINLRADGNIQNTGHLLAGSDINSTLTREADLNLTSKGDVRSSGSLLSKKNVTLSGKRVDLSQAQLAANQATIKAAQGGVALNKAKVDSKKITVETTGDIDARQAQVKAGSWDVSANNLFNQQGAWSQTEAGESRFNLSGQLDNTGGSIEASSLALNAGSLNNHNARLVALENTDERWNVSGQLDNSSGELGSNGSLNLTTGSLNNLAGSVKSLSSLQITASGDVNNANGKLLAGKDTILKAEQLNNRGGTLSGDHLQLTSAHLDNSQGQMIGQQNVHIETQQGVDNRQGLIAAGTALVVQTNGDLANQGGTLQSDTQLNVAAGNVSNAEGKILAGDAVNLNAKGGLDNQAGEVSGTALTINTQLLNNEKGKFIGQHSLNLNTADLINTQGLLNAGQKLTLTADGRLDNQNGEISGVDVGINSAKIDNSKGKIIAVQDIELNGKGDLENSGGLIQAGGNLDVHVADDWNNQSGAAQGGNNVNVDVRNLNNSQGRLQSGGSLALNTDGDVKNLAGKLTAQDQLVWQSADKGLFSNGGGSLQSGGDMILRGGSLSNGQQGVILSQKGLTLSLDADLDNRDGKITGFGASILHAANFYNAQGSLNALDSLDMQLTSTLDNGQGRIFSQASQTLHAQSINNNQGWMGSQGKWQADTALFDNTHGTVQTNQDAQLSANSLHNQQGVLQSAADMSLQIAQDIDNRSGKISAQNQLAVTGSESGKPVGAINNANGQWLAGEILKISARAIDNTQGGLLYSQKFITLDLVEGLNNQQGKVQSGDTLSLSAQMLQNSGGALDSQEQMSLRILGELNNVGGTLRSEGNQQITAQYFNNQNGLTSSRGSLDVNVPQIDNGNGTLISQGAGAYDADVLNNGNGKIHSGNMLTITGRQINNTAGQLVSTQALELDADTLSNNGNGTISSQAGLRIESNTLNNRDGGSILGTAQTFISAREIDNTSGSLQGAGSLTLTGLSLLNNQQGHIVSNGALSINALNTLFARAMSVAGPSLLNQNGTVQSGDTLSASLQSLNNQGGTLQSQKGMNLSLAQDYTHRAGETLSSNGTLTLSVAGVLTNLTDWLLPGGLTLNATNIFNPGRLAGKALQLTTGNLQNTGRIDADNVTLAVDTLDNTATIMGDSINVNGRIIDNHGAPAVIAATQSLDLQTRERLTNRDGALIYSSGRLHMSSGDLIENRASSIEADGDVTVEANRLDNLREGLAIARDAEQSDYKQHLNNYYWRSYGEDVNTDISTMAPTTQQLTFRNDTAAASNPYGTLLNIDAGAKRAEVQVKDNKGQIISLWVNYLALVPNADGSYAMTFYETRGPRQRNVPTPYQNTVWWNATDSEKIELWSPDRFIDIASAPYVTDYNNLRERTITGTVTRDKLISAGTGASLLSGGNMVLHIAGQLQNDAGTISSNGNMTIDGTANVINRGYSVNERRQEYIVDHYDRAEGHWYPTHNLDTTTALTTIDGVISGHGNVSIAGTHIENTTVNQAQISGVAAALKAIDAEKAEWQRNPLAFSVDGAGSEAGDTTLLSGIKGSAGNASALQRPLLPAEIALTALQQLSKVATSIPNNGLYRQNPAVGSPYLIVTDERFTSRTTFISSDYLLSRVDYDPSEVHKRLGDGFYEQKLVRDQVLSLTGRQSVQGEDAMEQYQNLMNNGAKVAQDFHLVPGVALTPEQIASLQQDIVWLVNETVETETGPQTVWVPKVYLAQSTLRLTGDGALIAGGDLKLSANSLTNAGNVMADKALSIDAGQFSHLSGDIKADTINVQADSLSISTNLQDALRQATLSASDISLSGNDVLLQGAKLDASNNLSVSARDNLDIRAAKSSVKADLQVISGSMGNRTSDGIEEVGQRMAQVSGEWQQSLGSELNAGGNMLLKAGHDVTLQGSQASAGGEIGLQAGGDVKLLADKTTNTTQLEASSRTSSVSNTRSEDQLSLSTLSGNNGVTLIAGKDLLAEGAQVDSTAGRIGVSAENVTIKAASQSTEASDTEHTQKGKTEGQRLDETSSQKAIGSTFSAQGGVTTIARTGDITVTGSTLHSEEGEIALSAKRDVTLNTATENESQYLEEHTQHNGMLSKSSSHTIQQDSITTQKGTLLSGNTIKINAGNDLTVTGSAIAADQDVTLKAGNNVTLSAATETESHYLLEEQSKSGLMSSGGIGFTVGSQSTRHELDEQGTLQSQSFSTVGSSQGNVSITAGNKLDIGGTDLIAGKDLSLTGDSVVIDSGFDKHNSTETFESKQSGFTLALSGTVGSALNTAVSVAQQARKESDSRLSALQGTKAVLSGAQAAVAYEHDSAITEAADAKNAAAGIDPKADDAAQGATNTVGVSLSYGSQSSKSESHSQSNQATSSTLNAGRNISITATGKNNGDESGDISIFGSQLKAGGDISLDAARDITLQSSKSTEQTESKNSSKGGTVGIGIGVGSGGYGISVSASVNSSKGSQTGNSLTHNETTLDAGNAVHIISGRDTTLKGAQVSGESITADIGRNLTLQSEQDSDRYDSKQQSASAGGSFTFGSMTGSVNVNVSRDKIHSNFDSVKEQTGLFAGEGGYNITVGNHTQLDGAVISSTADKDKNLLDTGTLGWSDIHNQADYKSEHQSAGFNSGGPIGANLLSNVSALPISGAGSSGHAEGTTKAAVSEGGLIIRNKDGQSQNLSDLSRDTEHANDGAINPIFDKEKEQKRLQQAQLVSDIASQALDIYNTHEAAKATRAATASMSDPQLKAGYENKARAELARAKELDPKVDTSQTAVSNKAWQLAYDSALSQQGANMGGSVRTGVNAVVNALQALAGGDIKAALAQGAAPYLAAKVKEITTDNADYSTLTNTQKLNNLMAHAILGGVIAELSGGSAAAGATGAVTGELAAPAIALALYGTSDSDKLTSEQKENLSALATLASGIAAGVGNDSASGAISGAQAGKNAVENNFLLTLLAPPPPIAGQSSPQTEANAAIAKKLEGVVKMFGEEQVRQCLTGGSCPPYVAGALLVVSMMADKGDDTNTSAPNIGKNLTKEEKKEIGGTGSSGGQEPEDNENWNKLQSTGSKDYKSGVDKGDKVNLDLFSQRKSNSGGRAEFVDPKTGWKISPDRAGNNSHGGSAWKLLDKNGNRIATLDKNGNVLRK